ncbi:MAG TPA: phosphodiesterase [Firmicutes bacterium]|jgi:putative phosphoesterase|nr:phosphodiesterase [Bacillota bacterium]
MLIGIISDTHGSTRAWLDAINGPFRGVEQIWHCGDVLYHGARNPLPAGYNTQELFELINSCSIPIKAVRGNCDSDVDQMVLDIVLQDPYFMAELPFGRALVTHGHHYGPDIMEAMIQRFQIKLWVSGHIHEPVLQRLGDTIFLNPGSPALPKGREQRRSVALLTDTSVELHDLDKGQVFARLDF